MSPTDTLTNPIQKFGIGFAILACTTSGVAAAQVSPVRVSPERTNGTWTSAHFSKDGAIFMPPLVHQPQPRGAVEETLSPAASVLAVHNESGLTWDQVARLMGVSRRAIHHWAAGGSLNAGNEERLTHVLTVIRSLTGTTSRERRRELLAAREGSSSRFDELLRSLSHAKPIQVAPYSPDQLTSGA